MKPLKGQIALFPAGHERQPRFKLESSPAVTALCPKCGCTIIVRQDLPGPGQRHVSEYRGKGGLCWSCSLVR